MTFDLPGWVKDAPDFDPDRWFLPLICTHGKTGQGRAAPDVLTVLVRHPESGEVGYLHTVYASGESVSTTEAEREAAREAGHRVSTDPRKPGDRPDPRRVYPANRRGSVNVWCPTCQPRRNKRFTRKQWIELLESAPAFPRPFLDLSALG